MEAVQDRYRVVTLVGPREIEVRTEEVPELGAGQVRVSTLYSGISAGTEMNVYRGDAAQWTAVQDGTTGLFEKATTPQWQYPLAYGYAAVGRVTSVSQDVSWLQIGELVFMYSPHASEQIMDASEVIKLPELADPRVGVLNANLNTAYNGFLDATPVLGDVVVVSGLGVIGLLVVQLLREAGIRTFGIDSLPKRRELAIEFGAEAVFAPSADVAAEIRQLTDNRGADIVIEVSGAAQALNEAIRIVGYNGTVIAMSWYGGSFESLNLAGEFHHNRPRIIGSQVGGLSPHLGPMWSLSRRQQVVEGLLQRLDLEPLITDVFPVEAAADAYKAIDAGDPDIIQVLLRY